MLSHGFLAEHGLAGGGGLLGDDPVQGVRSGYVDDVHLGVVDHFPPVRGPPFTSEVLDRGRNPGWDRVRHRHQSRVDVALGKVDLDVPVGAAVGLAHPSESDQPDPWDYPAHLIAADVCDNAQS